MYATKYVLCLTHIPKPEMYPQNRSLVKNLEQFLNMFYQDRDEALRKIFPFIMNY